MKLWINRTRPWHDMTKLYGMWDWFLNITVAYSFFFGLWGWKGIRSDAILEIFYCTLFNTKARIIRWRGPNIILNNYPLAMILNNIIVGLIKTPHNIFFFDLRYLIKKITKKGPSIDVVNSNHNFKLHQLREIKSIVDSMAWWHHQSFHRCTLYYTIRPKLSTKLGLIIQCSQSAIT